MLACEETFPNDGQLAQHCRRDLLANRKRDVEEERLENNVAQHLHGQWRESFEGCLVMRLVQAYLGILGQSKCKYTEIAVTQRGATLVKGTSVRSGEEGAGMKCTILGFYLIGAG
eukprot:TRINITY_DN17563_c0_g1_i1.p2 TRINITY_DN17563_c0_g1~~TRINITY_DN17563_c0_g1_i1.p2  ORF type:complete len:115 (+),score=6.91 TRINITY_DN17563_c0_g1_i1:159-503(+)